MAGGRWFLMRVCRGKGKGGWWREVSLMFLFWGEWFFFSPCISSEKQSYFGVFVLVLDSGIGEERMVMLMDNYRYEITLVVFRGREEVLWERI